MCRVRYACRREVIVHTSGRVEGQNEEIGCVQSQQTKIPNHGHASYLGGAEFASTTILRIRSTSLLKSSTSANVALGPSDLPSATPDPDPPGPPFESRPRNDSSLDCWPSSWCSNNARSVVNDELPAVAGPSLCDRTRGGSDRVFGGCWEGESPA
jgi:hypothetical protein